MLSKTRILTASLVLLGSALARCAEPEFALRDGDTVAFLGDSITAARGYTKIVELCTLMRYPERRVRFWNAGQGGDTAAGSVERLERDVFNQGATVVTVAFGVNDSCEPSAIFTVVQLRIPSGGNVIVLLPVVLFTISGPYDPLLPELNGVCALANCNRLAADSAARVSDWMNRRVFISGLEAMGSGFGR